MQAFKEVLGPDFINHIVDMSNNPKKSASEEKEGETKSHIDEWFVKSSFHKNSRYHLRPQSDLNEQQAKRLAEQERHSARLSDKPITQDIVFKWIASVIVISKVPQPTLHSYFENDGRGIYGSEWFKRHWLDREHFYITIQ